jgi:uracil-DNA glycosylase
MWESLGELDADVVRCRRCPRLVAWREQVAREKVARFRDEPYWGRPVPGFGDPEASILVVGLAPAAHGGNRTGRVFTGDASGDFLWRALHAVGLASQPSGRRADDGLTLFGVYVTAAVKCAPPANKPTIAERDNCFPYLVREFRILRRARVVVALGSFGWEAAFRALGALGPEARPRPRLGPGVEGRGGAYAVIASFHPSQQNTFTGRLTGEMLEAVFRRATELASPA